MHIQGPVMAAEQWVFSRTEDLELAQSLKYLWYKHEGPRMISRAYVKNWAWQHVLLINLSDGEVDPGRFLGLLGRSA